MSVILVEEKKYKPAIPLLDAIADAATKAGRDVVRWQDRNFALEVEFEAAFIWNGFDRMGKGPRIEAITARTQPGMVRFLENGWLDQTTSFQFDRKGINGFCSWLDDPLPKYIPQKMVAKPEGFILVALQSDQDSNLRLPELNPHKWSSAKLAKKIIEVSDIPVKIRQHPRYPTAGLKALDFKLFDHSETFQQALHGARAVVTINSTSGVEAMWAGVPVLAMGNNVYTRPGLVVRGGGEGTLKDDINKTIDAQGLDRGLQMAWLEELLYSRQFYLGQVPFMIAMMLEANQTESREGLK